MVVGAQALELVGGDGGGTLAITLDHFCPETAHEGAERVNMIMNTTTFELPRITTLVAIVQPARHTEVQTPVCRDALNLELVRCARGQGDCASGRCERWLFAPLVAGSVLAMVAAATTAGQWLAQWQGLVQWSQRILGRMRDDEAGIRTLFRLSGLSCSSSYS